MATGATVRDLIPERLARPAALLSTLAASAGAFLLFWSAVTGDYWWAIWGGAAFAAAALLWHAGEYAVTRGPAPGP